jgi:dipeptidyl-peptidase-4
MIAAFRVKVFLCLGIAALSASTFAQAQQRGLSLDVIYDPATRVDFSGSPPTDMTWLDADHYLLKRRVSAGNGVEWLRVDATTGESTPLFDASRMEAALAALPGITRGEAAQHARSNDLIPNAAHTAVLLSIADDLYFYDFSSGRALRLTAAPGEEEEATFSPDGRLVAFVRASNLFVVDLASQREQTLTSDGSSDIFNGKLDWLYQEEIYGRGNFRAYWWSPDSTRLAFLRLDERPVPEYTVVDHIPYRPTVEVTDYPKAGDPNPLVKLGIARVAGGAPTWVDLSAYSTLDFLLVNVAWKPDSADLVYQVQDREQTWLDLNLADARSGQSRKILHETTRAWVNENGNPVWLKDGSFLWLSERSGFRHLYRYRVDGTQVRQITSGRWEVRPLYGVDQENGFAYFASGERRVIGTDIYRITLDGGDLTRLSRALGTHRPIFNPTFTRYVDIWNTVTSPNQVRLHRADGSEVRVIDANQVKALSEYRLSTPEFLQIKARDGVVMNAMMIKPPDFTPSRRYPVFQHTYSGPGTQSVRDQWGGTQYLFHQLLAQNGIIVWILDNRSASGYGAEAQWPVYGNLGELELRDLEDGITWLKQQPYVDASRIVLSGWSYGGFMTAYALTHSTSWAAGIAGAPVTDWRDYDTIYTERLMKLPQNNAEGYRKTAPRFAADQLHGRLLLMHGTIDDNVHLQNSEQFAYELQRAGKTFDLMIYPKSRHAIADPRLNKHLRQTMFEFVQRVVDAPTTRTPVPTASR